MRALAVIAFYLASVAVCSGGIDFTPRYDVIESDGIVRPHTLYLQDGAQRVFLRAPSGWELTTELGALCMKNPAYGTGRVDIRASAVKLPVVFDAKWTASVTQQLLKSLPSSAKKAEVVEASANPGFLANWKSFAFRLTYEAEGMKLVRQVCFVTLRSEESIEMVAGGEEGDCAAACSAGAALLNSWIEPPPKVLKRMMTH